MPIIEVCGWLENIPISPPDQPSSEEQQGKICYEFSTFVKLFLFVLFRFDQPYAGVYRHQCIKVSHVGSRSRFAGTTGSN
jgi:hypothetical protein